jgi:hypothetical protein
MRLVALRREWRLARPQASDSSLAVNLIIFYCFAGMIVGMTKNEGAEESFASLLPSSFVGHSLLTLQEARLEGLELTTERDWANWGIKWPPSVWLL